MSSNVAVTIELTAVEYKALSCICSNVHEWVDNAATARAYVAYDEIVTKEVARMMADPTIQSIPANKDEIVMSASLDIFQITSNISPNSTP